MTIDAQFRVYHNVAESIADHAELLATSGYYQRAMADRAIPDAFANDLTGVYATDPDYGANLHRDHEALQPVPLRRSPARPAAGGRVGAGSLGDGDPGGRGGRPPRPASGPPQPATAQPAALGVGPPGATRRRRLRPHPPRLGDRGRATHRRGHLRRGALIPGAARAAVAARARRRRLAARPAAAPAWPRRRPRATAPATRRGSATLPGAPPRPRARPPAPPRAAPRPARGGDPRSGRYRRSQLPAAARGDDDHRRPVPAAVHARAMTTAYFATAKGPLGTASTSTATWPRRPDSAGSCWRPATGCSARRIPRYSPVHGEKIGALNSDGTSYTTKSAASRVRTRPNRARGGRVRDRPDLASAAVGARPG